MGRGLFLLGKRWRTFLALLLIGAGICTACVPAHRTAWEEAPATDLQWPPKPDSARIRWVSSITNEQDAGIGRSFWARTLDLFTGTAGSHIVRPHGVLYDVHDRLFIADPGAGLVHCMDLGAGQYFIIGNDGVRLETPIGLAVNDRQYLYITDAGSGIIYRYDLNKRILQPLLTARLQRPTGIAWNPVNRLLYVVDTTANQVVVVNEGGVEQSSFGGQFNHPTDIWANDEGQLFVTDSLNASIKVFTAQGELLRQFGIRGDAPGEFNKPKGVATDSAGHIYVSDALLDAIQIFDREGNPLLVFGEAGTGRGEFWMPSGIFIDRHDRIFVADTYNRRIQVFRYLPGGDSDIVSVKTKP